MSTTVTRTRTTTARETVPTHRAVPPSPVRRNPVPGLRRRALTGGATLFWTALVVVPIYWLVVTSLRSRSDFTSDSLLAIVLPSAAFALPITVMILVSFLRDVPRSLFEAMIVDGAGDWRMLWSLAVPLARPALMAVAVYDGLQVWNGFLFPLILTQSGDKAVLPLALTLFKGQFGIDVPATMAAVVLSTLPMLALFILARRQLVAGLTAGFSK